MAKFISLEGIEFTGKSTLTKGLSDNLRQLGFVVATAHDPGTTARAEQIRLDVFQKTREGADIMTITKLYMEARSDLSNEVIKPFLSQHRSNKKAIFICDRFLDSTRVYIGLTHDIEMAKIFAIERQFLGDLLPDLTLICYFNNNNFEQELERRRQSTIEKRKNEKNVSIWHESNFQKMKLRQENYFKIIQVAKRNGEDRLFELINVSMPFPEVLESATNKILTHIL